jgi:hypothetical protein
MAWQIAGGQSELDDLCSAPETNALEMDAQI